MAFTLAVLDPSSLLESSHCPLPRNGGQRRHLCENLNLSDFDRRRHSMRCARLQASSDGFADIIQGLGFCASLGGAAGNRRTFGNEHSGFVWLQRDKKLILGSYCTCLKNRRIVADERAAHDADRRVALTQEGVMKPFERERVAFELPVIVA